MTATSLFGRVTATSLFGCVAAKSLPGYLAARGVSLVAFYFLWQFLDELPEHPSKLELLRTMTTGWLLFVPWTLWAGKSDFSKAAELTQISLWRRFFGLISGVLLTGACFALIARIVMGPAALGDDSRFATDLVLAPLVLVSLAFAMFMVGLANLEASLTRGATAGVLTLLLGFAILVSPFCLDGLIESHQDALFVDLWLSRAASLSPISMLAQDTLGLDVFRLETVYRRFLIGEQLLARRDLKTCLAVLASSGAAAGVLGALLDHFRTRKTAD